MTKDIGWHKGVWNKIDDIKNVNESTKNTTEPLQPLPYETIDSINFAS